MHLNDVAHVWQTDGFVILPGFIPVDEPDHADTNPSEI
jgi:hypothetical protein